MPHPSLYTDRLVLRPYVLSDVPDLVAEMGTSARFAITLREDGQLCGGVGLRIDKDHQHAELGYWIGVPYWGRGYATEAAHAAVQYGFESLKLHRIYASCVTENTASSRVLQKVGMQYEGCQRSHISKWGKFYDLDLYGLVKDGSSRT